MRQAHREGETRYGEHGSYGGRGRADRPSRQGAHHRAARLQPLARAARRARHPSLHRHGLWLQRVLAAARPRARRRGRHRQADRLPGRRHHLLAASSLITGQALFTTSCDWTQFDLGWMYTLFFVLLGVSAAIWGGWLERVGPRKAGVVAALCWCGGLMISAVGVYIHQLWMMWLGSGIIGGCGLGLGYISPVSTLIKWFPDRRGMATGMAIMGFGGGAMIGSPLATMLMNHYATPTSVGVWETFVTMGVIYFVFMLGGAFGYRLPPAGWKPEGWTPPANANAMITTGHVHLKDAHKTAAVLADLGGALPQRLGRHRHHRRRLADAAGDLRRQAVRRSVRRLRQFHRRAEGQGGSGRRGLRRPVLAVQHRRPLLLGLALRQDRAEGDLFHLLHARLHLLRGGADARHARHARRYSRRPSASSPRCMAAASPPSPPISPTFSARSSSAPFTGGCSPPGRPPASSGR